MRRSCALRAVGEELNGDFLYYWFRSREFREQAAALKSQTDMADYINLADIRSLRITLPTPPEQQAIAEVLNVLDERSRQTADSSRHCVHCPSPSSTASRIRWSVRLVR